MPSLHRTCLAVVAAGLLVGCGSTGSGAEPTVDRTAEPAGLPASYSFVLTSSCGERGFLGDFDVTVRDGRVVSARDQRREMPYEPRLDEVPTLQDLLDRAADARGEADLELDEAGRPVSLDLDPDPLAIDEEECYRVSDLRVTD